ncbi:MAG: hypothetical protein HY092_03075 [Candidatus Kerfeldbacteria bacterium]|nr:hypothetical protein [Candidatus Kerfeldbacteria bacterium]
MSELIASVIILLILGGLTIPLGPMPEPVLMGSLGALAAAFIALFGLAWRERPRDEREEYHRALAGRLAFLAGSGALVTAIIVQSLQHRLDSWLVVALATMLLAKVVGLIYGRMKL